MNYDKISYPQALEKIAQKYGIAIPRKESESKDRRRIASRERLFALNKWAADHFSSNLKCNAENINAGVTYLRQQRGFTEESINKFGIGFASSSADTLTQTALQAGYKMHTLHETGLSIKLENGRTVDRFRERVIFPIHTITGRIVGFGARVINTESGVAKYLNSPESDIYSKRKILYGLFFASKPIQQQGSAILVEGYTDVISLHQAGIENVISTSGTALTTEQVQLLKRFTNNAILLFDGDDAGAFATMRNIDELLKGGMNVKVVSLPTDEDPDSFARTHSAEQVREYIEANSEDFLRFKSRTLLSSAGDDPVKRADATTSVVGSIALIDDNIKRAVYIDECARLMAIDRNIISSEVETMRK
jgi:DNA primase